MCRQKIYYNTYADGAEDVTEKTTACRDGKLCPHPEVRKYNRSFPYAKLGAPGLDALKTNPYFLGELPTPRRSKSPSPAHRREPDIYTPGVGLGLTDHLPKLPKDHSRHRSHRHGSRHDREPSSPRLNRSNTTPHVVVIDQSPRSFTHNVPSSPGPVHVAEEYGTSSRRRDHDRPRHSPNPQTYVVDDDRERRRHHRERGRRLSTSAYPEVAPTPALAHVFVAEPRRPSLRRSATLVQPSVKPLAPEPPKPPKAKHLRWQDEVNARRARQNADIANRPAPEVHQDSGPPKGILKDTSGSKGKGREEPEVRELRRAVEGMALPRDQDWRIPTADNLNLYDRDRLRARFGGDEGSGRDRRSKVWVAGDRYQYF